MITTIEIEDLKCACVSNAVSTKVAYMIYPYVNGFPEDWLKGHSQKYGCSVVAVYVPLEKWNDYLTPWPEPGETKGAEPFGGEASAFLKTLLTKVILQAEEAMGIDSVTERDLIGVSLGGLFTLWQWTICDTFSSIACLSGSFWYNGFVEWFEKQNISTKAGKAFFLLGKDEPNSKVKAFRSVGVNTETIVEVLKNDGVNVDFEWVPGDHFANPFERADKAFQQILG